METQHSLISPSNFERRMLCAGSLNAEKDLPNTTSKYAEEGSMLHERTTLYLESLQCSSKGSTSWDDGLTQGQKEAVVDAGTYFNKLKDVSHTLVLGEFHERKYSLAFIHADMKGTADSVLILENTETQIVEVHVIDYKFGKGVRVNAYWNYQLILYFLGVVNDLKIKNIIGNKTISVHLHIVQPYIKNTRWDVNEIDIIAVRKKNTYLDVVKNAYDLNAVRTPHYKACRFCKAKPTCYALAKTVPKMDTDVFDLEDDEIAVIYDNTELVKLYLSSIEEYIRNKISNGGFEGYELEGKLSNRKWTDDAILQLPILLGEDKAFEITKKPITIGKAEKLLDKITMDELTTREVSGTEIVKI